MQQDPLKSIMQWLRANSEDIASFLKTNGPSLRSYITGRRGIPQKTGLGLTRLYLAMGAVEQADAPNAAAPTADEHAQLQQEAERELRRINLRLYKLAAEMEALLAKRQMDMQGLALLQWLQDAPDPYQSAESKAHQARWVELRQRLLRLQLSNSASVSKLRRLQARQAALQAEKSVWENTLAAYLAPTIFLLPQEDSDIEAAC